MKVYETGICYYWEQARWVGTEEVSLGGGRGVRVKELTSLDPGSDKVDLQVTADI